MGVAVGVESNTIIPILSAALEWPKYSVNTALPTQVYEAQLDYFGKYMFDLKVSPERAGDREASFRVEGCVGQIWDLWVVSKNSMIENVFVVAG